MRPRIKLVAFAIALLACLLGMAGDASAQKPYLTIYTHSNASQGELSLISWFRGDSQTDYRLTQLRANSSWNHYTEESPLYKERFAKYFSQREFPIICLQRSDGAYLYKASAKNIPGSPKALADEIDYYSTLEPTNAKGLMVPDSAERYGRLTDFSEIKWDNTAGQCPDGTCDPDQRFPWQRPDGLDGTDAKGPFWDTKDIVDKALGPVERFEKNVNLVVVLIVTIVALYAYRTFSRRDDDDDDDDD